MTKTFKSTALTQNGQDLAAPLFPTVSIKTHKIPNRLFILYCIPYNKKSFRLFQKRKYHMQKLNFSTDPLIPSRILNHTRKSYITSFEVFAKEYFKYLYINKSLKSLKEIRFAAYDKNPNKTIKKAWRMIHIKGIKSLAIQSPNLNDTSAIFKVISYHKCLTELVYERLYNSVLNPPGKHRANIRRYVGLVESQLAKSIEVLQINMSLLDTQDLESFIFKFSNLKRLHLESNSEMEDEALRKLVQKLGSLNLLSHLSLIYSECYSQQFLLNLLDDLGNNSQLKDLSISMSLCLSQNIKNQFISSEQFYGLQTLNLILSQSDRGQENQNIGAINFYEFFNRVSFPLLKHFRVHLESSFIGKSSNDDPSGLDSFLKFLSSLSWSLESLNIRFWGPSLEYFQWEKILGVIGTLGNLQDLELSEISYFNNFCIGLVTKVIGNIKGLKRLWLRPVNVTKTRFIKSFVDMVNMHESLSSLHIMINKFSAQYARILLRKLKELDLRTNCEGNIEQYREVFNQKAGNFILSPFFYNVAEW